MHYEDIYKTDEYGYQAFHFGMTQFGLSIPVGSKVELTEWAKQNRISTKTPTGTLIGFSRDGRCLRVRPDGIKTIYSYWPGFWKRKD